MASTDYESPLGMKYHYEITHYLMDLDNQQIVQVGLALGMNYAKLKRMRTLPDDMVAAWLRREDDVLEVSGVPTWKGLTGALKDVGQNGVAIKIQEEHEYKTMSMMAQGSVGNAAPPAPSQTINQVPDMKSLTLIKWKDSKGEQHRLRIVQNICTKWRTIGNMLGISDPVLESILSQYRGNLEDCCYAVMRQWIDNRSEEYPLTWDGLVDLLEDAECSGVADEVRGALRLNKSA